MKSLCTVCDPVYFKEHAIKLINSVEFLNTKLIVIVINPLLTDIELMKKINRTSKNTECNYVVDNRDTKTFFASARYIYSEDLIREYELDGIMFIDTDSLVLKDITFPESDYSLHLREPFPNTTGIVKEGSYVLGSSVYISSTGIEFAKFLREELNSYVLDTWYQDQMALWRAHNALNSKLNFSQLDKVYLDWDFDPNSFIWNAKGPRKYQDKRFINLSNKFSSNPFSIP